MSSQPGYDPEKAKVVGEIDPTVYDAVAVVLSIQEGFELPRRPDARPKRSAQTSQIGKEPELHRISPEARLAAEVARLSGLGR